MLLDLMLPDGDGLDVVRRVRQAGYNPRALIISARCDTYSVYRVDRARVQGFIDKDSSMVETLAKAITAVMAGRTFFSDKFVRINRARQNDSASFDKIP